MFDYSLAFLSPWWLLLLLLLPVLWWFSLRSLSGLGRARRWAAIVLRTVVVLAVICALAEIQIKRTSDRMTVIYLLDQSMSIPEQQRLVMVDYVNAAVRMHRNDARDDRAGVIVFGRDAAIEHPPYEDDIAVAAAIESRIETDHTNLAGAIKLAQATLPEDSAGRIVIICDGNENVGDAREQARRLAEAGVGIDVVPVRYEPRGEVAVEKVAIPSDVNRGQPFDLRVVVNNTAKPGDKNGGMVKGKLKVVRKTREQEELLQEQSVTIEPGKKVFTLREEIDSPDFYTYEAVFTPENLKQDALTQNNRGTAFTNVRGRGQVLLIEDHEQTGQFTVLVDRLRRQNIQVTTRPTDQPIGSLAELQPFDTVILGNVPREAFTDAQISMLVSNTRNMGAGLVMIGGENSFGAGGWANTELEQAMPVDFQIKNAKVAPVGALAMVLHACEMPEGNYWQAAIAKAAIRALGNQDYCGLIQWNGTDRWLWRPGMAKVGDNRKSMLASIDRMTPGDMPNFDPGLQLAIQGFRSVPDAAVRHMIVISDGDPGNPTPAVLKLLKSEKIKVSTVAVGTHGPPTQTPLLALAQATGGKFYAPKSPKALPQIFQKEARSVSRPLIYEREAPFQPQLAYSHDILKGIDAVPPITGFVMTTIKESPLVELALVSPEPRTGEKYNTVLATWTYGLGKSVAFTTDAGNRWAAPWAGWENYEKFFAQMVRWSMRPAGDQGKFTIASDVQDGKVQVVITALDKDDEFLNFLSMGGSAVGPDMKPIDLKVRQTAPGRYVGEFDARDAGSYFLMVSPGAGMSPLLTGVNVPYSAEFLDREPNEGLLKDLASLVPQGSEAGAVIEDTTGEGIESMLDVNSFRHNLNKATSRQDIWHWLLLIGACLFFADVFNRRVTVDLSWARPYVTRVMDKLFRREPAPVASATMERLRSRKAAITRQLDERRASVRFEPAPDAATDGKALEETSARPTPGPKPTASSPQIGPQATEPEDYTSRLLKAKKRVWDDRKPDNQ